MRSFGCFCGALSVVAALSAGVGQASPAVTPAPSTPVALDATHFLLVRGDRVLIYEVDPKKGYAVRVVNTALLDERGFVIGQFRPEARPSAGPTAPAAPPVPAPAPPAPPAVAPAEPPARSVVERGTPARDEERRAAAGRRNRTAKAVDRHRAVLACAPARNR